MAFERDSKSANGHSDRRTLLNGSSLSSLTGAAPSAKLQVEVRFPASSMAEVLETIHRLGTTGKLEINFAHGKAQDMKFASTRDAKAPDV